MTRRSLLSLPGAALAQTLAPGAPDAPARRALIAALEARLSGMAGRFERRTHREIEGWAMPYRLFRPEAKGKLPIVLFLHGAVGLGADNERQITGGNQISATVWASDEAQKLQPCYVVAPQTDRGWVRTAAPPGERGARRVVVAGAGESVVAAVDILKALIAELPADPNRVYLCGQSMGGGGAWNLLAHFGELLAGVVTFAGIPTAESGAENPAVPLWNFHGIADEVVPVQVSRDRMAARRKAGGKPLHTEYAGVGHAVWPWACSEPALLEWLFAQRR